MQRSQFDFRCVIAAFLASGFTFDVWAYADTARLVGSNDQAEFYIYTGSIKKAASEGDIQATGFINFKAPRQDGTRSAFRVVTYHCADSVNRQITVIIDVGHADLGANGAQTYATGRSVGQRLNAPPGTGNGLAFDLVCTTPQGRAPTVASVQAQTQAPPPIRVELIAPRNSLEAHEEQERMQRIQLEFERDKQALAAKRKRDAEDQLIQNGYIVRCEQTPHMIGGYIFYQGQTHPFERWNPSSYDPRGWRIKEPGRYVRRGNVLQLQGPHANGEFYINESVYVAPVAFGGSGLVRRDCAHVSGSSSVL